MTAHSLPKGVITLGLVSLFMDLSSGQVGNTLNPFVKIASW